MSNAKTEQVKEKIPAEVIEKIKQIIFLKSLRARLFIIIFIVGTVPSVLMCYGLVENYEESAVSQRTTLVQNQMVIIASHLISKNYLSNYQSKEIKDVNSKEVIDAEMEIISNLYDGRVMIINGNLKIVKDTYNISEGKTIISEEVIKCFQGESTSYYDAENGFIEMTTPIVEKVVSTDGSNTESSVVRGVMLTSISSESIADTMEVLNRNAIILETMMMMAIVVIAFILSGALTRPINRVTEAINEVKEGYSDESISVPDYVETVHIVNAFNQLLGRMRVLDNSRQEFVANVSHELKTPLTSMKVLADSLLAQPDMPVEIYQEFLQDIVSEIDRENQIITDLLALVKMDKRAQKLNIAAISINELTELIMKRLRPLARKRDIEVVFESIRPVIAEVDEVKMTLVLSNLVENAIKYNKEHGWVKVLLDADHQYFIFEVSDSGIGIPEEELPHIYERFYRADKSHSREIGGTGLGLAITKNAILMHRGAITVTSTEGEGSSFRVKIPLNYIVQGEK
ncbi:HAMP domain-containing histidine kinase [Lachnospiraceae bacterium OttesenSCG-928-D06]|nr:HAMP domain-containing histidine kinase [Lachnospiraceae bacterium OttesenSCG-928-D06]